MNRPVSQEARRLAMLAASQAAASMEELIAFGIGDDDALFATEVPEKLADALKLTLESLSESGHLDEDQNQLLGAVTRFLEGWAG